MSGCPPCVEVAGAEPQTGAITDAGAGPRLTYIRVFEQRMPAAPNYFEFDTVQDEFDGRLIDDLPEARYLGRLSRTGFHGGRVIWLTGR